MNWEMQAHFKGGWLMQMQNTYEYGVDLDDGVAADVWVQVKLARRLYNDIVAVMRGVYAGMQEWVMEAAGADAQAAKAELVLLDARFKEARAAKDDGAMKQVADQRRELWRQLAPVLKAVRAKHKDQIRDLFLARIGRNASTATYQMRCHYVDEEGLGRATATAVLDRALKAWADSMKKGKPPMFANAAEKRQDTLVQQFTLAGGLPVDAIMGGQSKELSVSAKPGQRGEFAFRLGAAKAGVYATGQIRFHRALPEGASVPQARLVAMKVADKVRYKLQLVVSHEGMAAADGGGKRPLLAVHFGWAAAEDGGKVVASANNTPDPSTAAQTILPADIGEDLAWAADVQSARDAARDQLATRLHEWPLTGDEGIDAEIAAIQKLPAQHIAQSRLHRLIQRCWDAGYENQPDWLRAWKSQDLRRWRAADGRARTARRRREDFYTQVARGWCANYQAIVVEPLDLKGAAQVVDGLTGERTEIAKKARAGRVVAAPYELLQALRWQAAKAGVALFEDTSNPKTVAVCSLCGSLDIAPLADDHQVLHCPACQADIARKDNAAAVLYQLWGDGIGDKTASFHQAAAAADVAKAEARKAKQQKMQEGRRAANLARAESNAALQ
jgi:hypothetical protein